LAYVSEAIWLFFGFIYIYLFIVRKSLARVYKVLLFRKEKFFGILEGIVIAKEEVYTVENNSNKYIYFFSCNLVYSIEELFKVFDDILVDCREEVKGFSHKLRSFVLGDYEMACDTLGVCILSKKSDSGGTKERDRIIKLCCLK
jgi:hypothetical protein